MNIAPGEKKSDFSETIGTGVGTREGRNIVFLRVMGGCSVILDKFL